MNPRVIVSIIGLGVLAALAWWKALQFDPYTMSFFTKTYFVPTPDMPGDMRLFAWVIFGIAALLGWSTLQGISKKVHSRMETALMFVLTFEIAAFGGAFFVAANMAESAIAAHEGTQ
jgi:hypothetical protein